MSAKLRKGGKTIRYIAPERICTVDISQPTATVTTLTAEVIAVERTHIYSMVFLCVVKFSLKNIIDGNEGQPRTGESLFDGFLMGKNPLAPSSDDKMANMDGTVVMGIVPNGSQITVSKDKYCRSCGAKRKEGAKFCAECGAKFD